MPSLLPFQPSVCSAPSSEPPKHDWNCSNCTFCNDAGTSTCSVCGTAYLDPSLVSDPGATAGPPPEPWSCLVCTFRNSPAVSQCSQCNTWRPAQAGTGAGAAAAEVCMRVNLCAVHVLPFHLPVHGPSPAS
jgi:hypothetical protein